MRIEKLTIRLGKTIPGPEYGGGQYANVKPEVEITALIDQQDDLAGVTQWMKAHCMAALDDLKQTLIADQTKIRPTTPVQVHAPQPNGFYQPAPLGSSLPPPPQATRAAPKIDPATW